MERLFNTAGPNNAAWHYTIDPLTRIDLDEGLKLQGCWQGRTIMDGVGNVVMA